MFMQNRIVTIFDQLNTFSRKPWISVKQRGRILFTPLKGGSGVGGVPPIVTKISRVAIKGGG